MINKKILSPLMLAASVLLASCSQDELMTDTGPDGLVPVTLSAAVGDGVQTRTVDVDDDEDATYCYVQVCDEQGNAYTDNDYATPTRLTDEDKDGTFTGNIYLKPGVSHVFLFWADNVTSTAPADLHNVTYQEESIAFADRVEQTISSVGPTVNATLQHVVAKVTLKTTTNVDASDKITVTIPTTYQAYNVNTEAPIYATDNTTFVHTVTSDITGTTDGAEVFSFYALVDEANQNLTLAKGTNSQRVSNVPLGPNKHTTLVGDVRNLGLTNVTFTASIDGKWGSTETEIIGLEIADDGTYIVSSPAALQAWATAVQSNPSLNCTLAADITLPTPAEGESNWIPVGMEWSDMFRGIFDGAGHTISNLVLNTPQQTRCLYTGFISTLYTGAVVKNLHIRNASVTGTSDVVGGIIGHLAGSSSVIGCSFTGEVRGNSANSGNVGGIAGSLATNSSIAACYSSGTISAYGLAVAGGIVGTMRGTSLTGCYSTAKVTVQESSSYCGDIVGNVINQATITACYHSVTDKGIGQNLDNTSTVDIIHIDDTNNMWESAMNAMNEALTNNGYKWQWKLNNGEDKGTFPLIVEETE